MNENLFEAQYDVSKKSKFRKFYESNKLLIFSTISIFLIFVVILSFYFQNIEKKKAFLSDSYIEAIVLLDKENNNKAKDLLKEIIFANNSTYSTLALFLLLNENLITDERELSKLFDHLLTNNKFDKEIKNLIIFKKAILQSDFVNEQELLETLNPLLNEETLWKPHALLLLGDYFSSKNEYIKAKEFYTKILSLKDLNRELYNQARSRLILIAND
tara:strand:- start:546 stop:1193 length:648 start_codon:yes stop_codon:yes gene_type:complete